MTEFAVRVTNLGKSYQSSATKKRGSVGARVLSMLSPTNTATSNPLVKWALKNISFEVAPGEIVGFVGSNGAGKSTLLKILARVTNPTEGKAELRGKLGSLLEVGTGFHPELTGRENVYLNGSILGMTRREIALKFEEIVDFAGAEELIDNPVKQYSSGQYMRLGFSVAAHLDQDILIIDEIMAVGDAAFKAKCTTKMNDLLKAGKTIIVVAHDASYIEKTCDRLGWLNRGELKEFGPTANILKSYLEFSQMNVAASI